MGRLNRMKVKISSTLKIQLLCGLHVKKKLTVQFFFLNSTIQIIMSSMKNQVAFLETNVVFFYKMHLFICYQYKACYAAFTTWGLALTSRTVYFSLLSIMVLSLSVSLRHKYVKAICQWWELTAAPRRSSETLISTSWQ